MSYKSGGEENGKLQIPSRRKKKTKHEVNQSIYMEKSCCMRKVKMNSRCFMPSYLSDRLYAITLKENPGTSSVYYIHLCRYIITAKELL